MAPYVAPETPVPSALTMIDPVHRYPGGPSKTFPSLTLAAGSHGLLLGPSGSGKSTLLHLAAGLVRPASGSVRVAGQDLDALRPTALDRFRGRKIGLVFQRLHLIASLSAVQNLLLAQTLAGAPRDLPRARHLLEQLAVGRIADLRADRLSVGQQQRVAIARAVINRPALILADEPTSSLDDPHAEAVLDLLQTQARDCGAALLIATHDHRVRKRIDSVLELVP